MAEHEVFGPYRLESLLGRGGMGEVHRAFDTSRDRVVAVKRLHRRLAADPEFRERFRRESRMAARISSPHVIPIHDYGEIDGQLFIDMRLVEGADLGDLISAEGGLAPARAVDLVGQIADALDVAHALDLVHRDVKPSNVLVTSGPKDFVYLVDFGIVRALDGSGGTSLTSTGSTLGTPTYMAPELLEDGRASAGSDVYALACVLVEALTGQAPFPATSLASLMYHHLSVDPPLPSQRRPELPAALDDVVARGMAKDPRHRPATAGALAEEALAALRGDTIVTGPRTGGQGATPTETAPPRDASSAAATWVPQAWTPGPAPPPGPPPVRPYVAPPGATPPPGPPGSSGTGGRGRRRPVLLAAVAAGVALVIALVVTLVVVGRDGTPSAAPRGTDGRGAVLPAGDGQAACPSGTSLAYAGTIAGSNAALGQGIVDGTQLAIDQHNAANPDCQVVLARADTGGTPDTAVGPVTSLINDPRVLGLVGLPFSGESRAVGPALNAAGLVSITPSATNPALAQNGWTSFFRGLGNDELQGPAAARFIQQQYAPQQVCVVRDDSVYGTGLADAVTSALGPGVAACQVSVVTNQADYAATVAQIRAANPQVVYFGGYYTEAAPLLRGLRDAGVTAVFVAPDGAKDEQFLTLAGGAADGAVLTCPCVPTADLADFSDAYRRAFGSAPPTYAAEAYDAATILLRGIDQGATSRPALLQFVRSYDGQGLTKRYRWGPTGELVSAPVWTYRVSGGQIVTDRQIG